MDGESSAQRDARLRELWDRLDTKKKGTLDLPALKLGLQNINHPLKDADSLIRETLASADVNQDGKISWDEFVRFCKETEKHLWTLFTRIDINADGTLSKNELAQAFERAGVSVSNARLDRFYNSLDRNNDGRISFAEWRGMF